MLSGSEKKAISDLHTGGRGTCLIRLTLQALRTETVADLYGSWRTDDGDGGMQWR